MKTHERIAENGYPFWIYTPDGYDGTKAQPIVVFLHGRSLCGRNLNQVLRYGTLDAIKKGYEYAGVCDCAAESGRGVETIETDGHH